MNQQQIPVEEIERIIGRLYIERELMLAQIQRLTEENGRLKEELRKGETHSVSPLSGKEEG